MRFSFALVACLMASLPTAAWSHKLIEANVASEVARSDLTVVPAIEWNRLNERPGSEAERWTLDGELLNDLLFFGDISEGDTLFRDRDRRNNPLPEFSQSMLLIDIPEFYGSSVRIAKGARAFELGAIEPVEFLANPGVRFDFQTIGGDDLRRKGRAYAALVEGKLYLISYEAPEVYFFDKNLTDFEQVVSSASIP